MGYTDLDHWAALLPSWIEVNCLPQWSKWKGYWSTGKKLLAAWSSLCSKWHLRSCTNITIKTAIQRVASEFKSRIIWKSLEFMNFNILILATWCLIVMRFRIKLAFYRWASNCYWNIKIDYCPHPIEVLLKKIWREYTLGPDTGMSVLIHTAPFLCTSIANKCDIYVL